jgi:hypothetical protein
MRLSRFGLLCAAITAVVGCSSEDITNTSLPALAGVRYINALADTGRVDVRMVDQVEWSATANNLNFRQGIEHQPTEAKARHIRVFSFASMNVNVVSQVLVDTTISFAANTKATLLLTGSARAGTAHFVVIDDTPPALTPGATGQIALRAVNASTGAVDAYVVTLPADAITGAPTAANVAVNAASAYVTRTAGSVALRVTNPGSTTANASAAGPAGSPNPIGAPGTYFPSAGVNNGGSAFSVYYFPPGVAGSLQTALTTPVIIWFVDRVPTS